MEKETKTCAICGKPSGKYPLCFTHSAMLKTGEVVKCEKCNTWHLAKEPCKCKPEPIKEPPKPIEKPIEKKEATAEKTKEKPASDELRCIVCGFPSDGKHFCKSCYYKYKDRSIDLRITHCNEVEILDEYGNLQYKCDDGRKVRSRAEMIISNFFFNNRVRAVYEETIYYKENDEDKTLHPDFYLPDYDYYIEYNELTNKPYLKSKNYAMKIYEGLGKKVYIMTEKDLQDISACLKPLLGLH